MEPTSSAKQQIRAHWLALRGILATALGMMEGGTLGTHSGATDTTEDSIEDVRWRIQELDRLLGL